jgi:hypothetical protein
MYLHEYPPKGPSLCNPLLVGEGTVKILTATARLRLLAVTIALQTFDLLLPLLGTEAVREVNEMAFEGQTFTVKQGEEHRCDNPAQQHQIGDERPCHTKSMHEPRPQRQICHSTTALSCVVVPHFPEQCYH